MPKIKKKRDHCVDNDVIYQVGDEWSDHGVCSLKVCESGGHISIKLCPQLDMSSGCNRIEGDLNQAFPQCCPTVDSGEDSSSESSSSSSSSDEEEDDLFDDDGEDMDVFKIEEPSSQNVTGTKGEQVGSNHKGEELKSSKHEERRQQNITKESKENSSEVTSAMIVKDVSNENVNTTDKNNDTILGKIETAHQDVTKPETAHQDVTKPETAHQDVTKPETVHQDVSKPETVITDEPPANESQKKDSLEKNNYDTVKSDTSENAIVDKSIKIFEKEEESRSMDMNKHTGSSGEIESVVENVHSTRDNVNGEIKNDSNNNATNDINSKHITHISSQESMDSVNCTTLASDLKGEKHIHILHAMDAQEDSGQYKLTDYAEDVTANDSELKKMIDLEMDTKRFYKTDQEVTSILNSASDTNKGNSDSLTVTKETIGKFDVKSRGGTDITESNLINKTYNENNEQERTGMDEMDQAVYKTEIIDGVVYSPEDPEGFMKKPDDNVSLQRMPNETIVENIIDRGIISDSVTQSILNENIENLVGENDVELNAVDTEDIFNKTEERGMFKNNDDLKQNLYIHSTHTPTDLAKENIEEPQLISHIYDLSHLTEENREVSTNIDGSNDLTTNTEELKEETNDFDDFTKSIIPSIEDAQPIDSFSVNLENQAAVIFEDHAGIQEETAGELLSDKLFHDSEDSAKTYQISEENNMPATGFEEVGSTEITEDQTYSSEYSTPSEAFAESSSEVVESTTNVSEDTEELQ